MRTKDFEYELPPELIAYYPAARREESRLMVLRRADQSIEHDNFANISKYLNPGDLLVVNDTKVIKARLLGKKKCSGGKVEILLVRSRQERIWEALVSPSRRVGVSTEVDLGDGYSCKVIGKLKGARRLIEFSDDVKEIIESLGQVPLPPYIKREALEIDVERYQTVYARKNGSVAAPTAGLHFSENVIEQLLRKGIRMASITLHIGPGTFAPVRAEDPRDHRLDEEEFEISKETCSAILDCRRRGGRVIAVGTTCVRALETAIDDLGNPLEYRGWTNKMIFPPYDFRVVDAMITNFHLPRSTLLMLVCAFAGREFVFKAYKEAVSLRYRFYSYGDSMLII
ncbi:MAG: tRNA preQ1(34) S-adenosylmethionine ribosyltransferase-isomerase QueA [bacterium]